MVNKVDGNSPYIYTKQKKIDVPDTDEKFSLGYQKKESSPDAGEKKEIDEPEKRQAVERNGVSLELSANAQDAGTDRQSRTEEKAEKVQNASGLLPLLETIRTYFMAAVTAVRDFFYQIWNGQPPQEDVSDAQLLEESLLEEGLAEDPFLEGDLAEDSFLAEDQMPGESLPDFQPPAEILQEPVGNRNGPDESSAHAMEEERRNREIQQFLRQGDMEHVISLLTDNGRKTIAKNSTLLSGYDKNGRMVEPDASVMDRIMNGDKNTWKL